jgi:hypothetical protein
MSKIACQYAIVRFAPYVETGEFANVGILMMAPNARYFGFKLQTRRHGRITGFFDELDPKLYREAVLTLREELQRIHELLKAHGFDGRKTVNDIDFARQLFSEVVRPRESIVRFSEPGIVLADDPKEKLKDLFAFYVERNFVTKEYRETILEKGVRQWLYQAKIGDRFQRMAIGDDDYQATFPFVEQIDHQPVKAIKPLHLAQNQPSKIMDHGAAWLFRLNELKRRDRLPEKVLFTVDGPEDRHDRRQRAFDDIVGRLQDTGVEVTNYTNRQRVLEFAGM